MTLSAVYRATATFIVAVFALGVQNIHPLRRIFPFRVVAFTARGRCVTFIFKVMVAISTFDAVTIFGKMSLVIKENVTARILEHNPDGIFRGFFCKCCVTNHANNQKSRRQTAGDGSKSLVIHDYFP
jgi:hypothetical protein